MDSRIVFLRASASPGGFALNTQQPLRIPSQNHLPLLFHLLSSPSNFLAFRGTLPIWCGKSLTGVSASDGYLYCRKVAKNFGQWDFLQHAKMDDERFRAFFVGENWAKVMIVELCPKIKKMAFPSVGQTVGKAEGKLPMDRKEALSNQHPATSPKQEQLQNQRRFTTEDTEATEENKTLPLNHGKPVMNSNE